MTPRSNMMPPGGPKPQTRTDNVGAETIRRIKILIAAGAVAGTIGGWALSAQQNVTTAAQPNTSDTTIAALVQPSTPTSIPQATVVLQQALQATATAIITT